MAKSKSHAEKGRHQKRADRRSRARRSSKRSNEDSLSVPSVGAEFAGAELGDPRRTRRAVKIADALGAAPNLSLPEILQDDAALEALYRFTNNSHVTFEDLIRPHFAATAARAAEHKEILELLDLSELSYPHGEHLREGFGRLGSRQGLRLGVSLAVTSDPSHRPLGLLGATTWGADEYRPAGSKKKFVNIEGRMGSSEWGNLTSAAKEVVPASTRVIHVIDREASAYDLFAKIIGESSGFVIRLVKQRVVELEDEPGNRMDLVDAAKSLKVEYELSVPLSRRRPNLPSKVNPPRDARVARLAVSAAAIRMKKPAQLPASLGLPASLVVNLVHVIEVRAPEGEEPVQWLLATTEPIETQKQIKRVVDIYRARWTIEEFFRVLKSGCHIEDRQLESRASLEKILAIFLVVAWRILLLRYVLRQDPDAAAAMAFTPLQLFTLRADERLAVPKDLTVGQALLAVARLGGHIKGNGDPGLTVLARGMARLLERTDATAKAVAFLRLNPGLLQ
jgi:hypothetical protein